MFRIAMAVVLVAAIMGVGVSLSAPPAAAQQPSATRSFDKTTVEPGENVTVTITIEDYGGLGAVTEMLPDGFSYLSSDLDTVQVTEVDARTVRFTLQGDSRFTYTVTASSAEGSHTFSGELRDSDRKNHTVGGDPTVTVEAPAGQQASATRSFDKTTVEPGENVTVTITAGNYGGVGAVTEMLPDGFSYVSSDLDTEQVTEVDPRTVRFTLRGDASFTYTVTASSAEGSHTFSGELRDSDLTNHTVGGDPTVTVEAPAGQQASATRSFDKTTVEPGENVMVTITRWELWWGRGGDGDAARWVQLRIQRSRHRTGHGGRPPDCEVHPARGCLIYVHRNRVQRGGFSYLLRRVAGLR